MAQENLTEIAKELRRDIVKMVHAAKSGHPGGSLSMVEFITALYFDKLNHDPKNSKMENRDRVILSKGHAAPALYAALGNSGYFPKEDLLTLRKFGSHLQGHASTKTNGIEVGTGSLGQGLSLATGIALSARMDDNNFKTYAIMGDGELQEGQIWEAAMYAGNQKLNNLCAFVDFNNLQIDGRVSDINDVESLKDKWESFNWFVIEIDGNNMNEVLSAIEEFKTTKQDKPVVIIGKTLKGKGVSFMEDQAGWHGKAPSDEELEIALNDLK